MRGALELASALSFPRSLPLWDAMAPLAFGVDGCSVVVQGLTEPVLLRRPGFVQN
jgi:Na+:H+ antiporter